MYLPRQMKFNTTVMLLFLIKSAKQLKGNMEPASEYSPNNQGYSTHFGSPNFKDILKSKFFIDKSMFIESFLTSWCYIPLVTAPRMFGKSVNLDMLREFLEIKVNDRGEETLNKSQTKELFKNLNIFNYQDIVNRHMGQYPVIYVDLKCNDSIQSYDDVLNVLTVALNGIYAKHDYLLQSMKLNDTDKAVVKLHCGSKRLKNINNDSIIGNLKNLSCLIYKHFNKKPIVLIDNYDSSVVQSIFKTSINTDMVICLISTLLGTVLKDNNYLERGFITGTLYIPHACPNNVINCGYLNDQEFGKHYGATEKEVRELFTKHGVGEQIFLEADKWYSGYCSCSTRIFCIGSVIQFLEYGTVARDWHPSGFLLNCAGYFRLPDIKDNIDKLILGMNIDLYVASKNSYTIQELKTSITNMNIQFARIIFWEILHEMGYLTYSDNSTEYEGVTSFLNLKVPNKYIEVEFLGTLTKFYEAECHFNIDASVTALNGFSANANGRVFDSFLYSFNILIELFKKKELRMNINKSAFQALLYCITCRSVFKSEVYLNKGTNQVKIVMTKGNLGIVIELKYDTSVKENFNTGLINNEHLVTTDHKLWQSNVTDSIFMHVDVDRDLHVTATYKINDGKVWICNS